MSDKRFEETTLVFTENVTPYVKGDVATFPKATADKIVEKAGDRVEAYDEKKHSHLLPAAAGVARDETTADRLRVVDDPVAEKLRQGYTQNDLVPQPTAADLNKRVGNELPQTDAGVAAEVANANAEAFEGNEEDSQDATTRTEKENAKQAQKAGK